MLPAIYNLLVAAPFHFEHSLPFAAAHAAEILRSIPARPGVFALYGPPAREGETDPQPYLTRAADLRRRITRILSPPPDQSNQPHLRPSRPAELNPHQPQPAQPQPDHANAESAGQAAAPSPLSRRLNLSARVARIEYSVTGSEFESTLALYHASASIFGLAEARRRLRLHTPFFLRFTAENAFPRLYTTNRLSRRALAHTFGPFPSRAAADRYCEAIEDLYLLRRCYEELDPAPDHPGCIYGEMGKCLAPCNRAQVPANAAAYSAEAAAVQTFLSTRGESLLAPLAAEREQASADLNFERAAELHTQIQKIQAALALADPLVQPIPQLRALIVQRAAQASLIHNPVIPSERSASAPRESRDLQLYDSASTNASPPASSLSSFRSQREVLSEPAHSDAGAAQESASPVFSAEPAASLFLLEAGRLFGPAHLSTLGVRAVREQTAVGSSLFAQPLMLSAIPLDEPPASGAVILSEARSAESNDPEALDISPTTRAVLPADAAAPSALNPEARAAAAIASLEAQASAHASAKPAPDALATLSDHLSLLRRWYYRPEKQRAGEVFLPRENGTWPLRRILRAAARAALGDPATLPDIRRDLAQRNPAEALPPSPLT